MFKVMIPATSANLGPGFDCMGVALNVYNTIEVEEVGEGLQIETNDPLNRIPLNENNLIYKSMKAVFDIVGYTPKGLRIVQTNDIPMTRGLGSSAACIVGGVFAANQIVKQKLNFSDLSLLAAKLDGHPDNTTPAIMGGIAVAVLEEKELFHVKLDIPDNIKFAAFIPDFTLSTAKARKILPQRISHKDAVFNVGRAALLLASLINGNFENLSCAFKDRLHQPFRRKLIPNMDKILSESMQCGARGGYISGAGPTLIAILDKNYEEFYMQMNNYIKFLDYKWELKLLELSKKGVEVL